MFSDQSMGAQGAEGWLEADVADLCVVYVGPHTKHSLKIHLLSSNLESEDAGSRPRRRQGSGRIQKKYNSHFASTFGAEYPLFFSFLTRLEKCTLGISGVGVGHSMDAMGLGTRH